MKGIELQVLFEPQGEKKYTKGMMFYNLHLTLVDVMQLPNESYCEIMIGMESYVVKHTYNELIEKLNNL